MIRLYGKAQAFIQANRYAADCTANGDANGHARWAAAAAQIGELMESNNKFGKNPLQDRANKTGPR